MRIEFVEAGSAVRFELHEVDPSLDPVLEQSFWHRDGAVWHRPGRGRTARANLIQSHLSQAQPAARS